MFLPDVPSTSLQTGVNAFGGLCFMVAVYFLKSFVESVRELQKDVGRIKNRVTRLETHLEMKPEEVGIYAPPKRPAPFYRRD